METAKNLFSLAKAYVDQNDTTVVPDKVKKLIKDLEAKLPNLPAAERNALVNQIAMIKTAARTNNYHDYFALNASFISKATASHFFGPVGSAFATFKTNNLTKQVKARTEERIGPARKVAGQRMVPRHKRKEKSTIARLSNTIVPKEIKTIAPKELIDNAKLVTDFAISTLGGATFSQLRSWAWDKVTSHVFG